MDKRIKKKSTIVTRAEDAHAFLYDPDKESIYCLDSVGFEIWKLLDGTHSTSEIVSALAEEFEEVPDNCSEYIESFISSLAEEELVE